MSNYTQLGFIKQTDGENEGSWGDALNENLIDLLDDAIGGYVEISVASGNVTLAFADGTADNNGRHAVIKFTGSPGTTRTVTFPDKQINYFIVNGSDSSVICTSGTGAATVTIPTGMKDVIYIDGSDEVLSMFGTPHLTSSGNFTVDATTDIILDADGGDIFFKDGGTTFGSATNTSGNLIVKSGTTTALTFSGANVTAAGNLTVDGNLDVTGTLDLSDSNFTNVGSLQLDSIAGDGDTDTSITFSGSNVITVKANNEDQLTFIDGAIIPSTDDNIDLGSSSAQFKDAYIDGTLEADAITIAGATLAETISDTVGAMVSSNTETGITVTYQDGDNTLDFALGAAQTTITSLLATDIKIGEDDETKIDFETADTINFYAGNEKQLILTDGALTPGADNILDLGSSGVEFKDGYFDGTVTADAFAGPLTGDVTGNVSGTAATVTTAAQSNITSLGTLTTLTVDNVIVNGTTIGHTDDTDLITLADGVATVAGEISVTTLDIGGTNVAATAAELNIMDGGTAASSVTLADADRLVTNDDGTMKQVALSTLKTYLTSAGFSSEDPTALAIALG